MIARLDAMLRPHQTALDLRVFRQELLAGNIANADTPHFKARDIDFANALQASFSRRVPSVGLAATSPRHIGGQAQAAGVPPALYRVPYQAALDGNTVETDMELARFAENAIHIEASLEFISAKLRTMLAAIRSS
jgi:flagellar basal-body rod protein FlgB